MIDPCVRQLLEKAIDSSIKLQFLLLFYEDSRLEMTAQQIANRSYRDIWSTREALQELEQDGILTSSTDEDPRYLYQPRAELVEQIERLMLSYNEPIERDGIQHMLREVSKDASFHRARRQMQGAYELQMI
jgi:DNA-binding MarR family transcriptional regulator